jgi:hypothetical protein
MVGLPLLLYPMSHTLAIALDLLVRPSDSVFAGRADPARAGQPPRPEETD